METLILMLGMGCINVLCFFIGAKVGQQASKGEPIAMPEVNPIKAWDGWQDRKEAKKEKDKYDAILENIEAYDGTSIGQKDIPR